MHFQTSMEANENLKSMYMCINCGELAGMTKKLYCKNCDTAEKRKLMALEQKKVMEENIAKGFHYAKVLR